MTVNTNTDPVIEGFKLLAASIMTGDEALLTLCNELVKRVNELALEVCELRYETRVLQSELDKKSREL